MSGSSTPCSSMFMLPMRSMVASKSKPWKARVWKCSRGFAARSISGWRSRRYSPAATRKPPVPQAGSQMTSLGPGAVISTISRMMWRGVRNWPFWPAEAILPSMYS